MSDDNRFHNDPDNPPDDSQREEIPASVAFMEMMRQAAAKANPTTPDPDPVAQPASAPAEAPSALTEGERAQAIEEQRILRVKRRKARRRRQTVGILGGIVRTFIVVVVAAGLTATIFTWWTPSQFISQDVQAELSVAQATSQVTVVPTGLPTPNWLRRVGVVSGHRGPEGDPGAVCPDGLTEAEVNFAVAQLVVRALRGRGYSVDLLDEFDPRLDNYQAAALISIHANTCQDFGEFVSGFLIAAAAARVTARGNDDLLVNCVAQYYGQATGLQRRDGVTVDMTDYHTFREIHPVTPATIIELGFLLGDRAVLTGQQDAMAQAITDGILCFLEPAVPGATPTPVTG
jgi:N-acetylmuramoyl-L-alanine amidase